MTFEYTVLYGKVSRRGAVYIDAQFELDIDRTGFSAAYHTTDSFEMSLQFGLRYGERPTEEARQKIQLVTLFEAPSAETFRVVRFFSDLALKGGWFAALPYKEIPEATRGQISQHDLERAREEGYLQVAFYPGVPHELAELGPQFQPVKPSPLT